ncbi:MAG TPA: hypothetical protein VM163_10155 [bacterium]|nr:hypothetical protein [bacterium]
MAWFWELLIDRQGKRTMELIDKLASSRWRFFFTVANVILVALLCIFFIVDAYVTTSSPYFRLPLLKRIMRILPLAVMPCGLIVLSGIIMPITYLISLKRIGEKLRDMGANEVSRELTQHGS